MWKTLQDVFTKTSCYKCVTVRGPKLLLSDYSQFKNDKIRRINNYKVDPATVWGALTPTGRCLKQPEWLKRTREALGVHQPPKINTRVFSGPGELLAGPKDDENLSKVDRCNFGRLVPSCYLLEGFNEEGKLGVLVVVITMTSRLSGLLQLWL